METAIRFITVATLLVIGCAPPPAQDPGLPENAGAGLPENPSAGLPENLTGDTLVGGARLALDWKMPDRTVPHYTRSGGRFALGKSPLPPPRDFINPYRWEVNLDSCASTWDGVEIGSWRWEVLAPDGRLVHNAQSDNCWVTVTVPELGEYSVRLTVAATDGRSDAKTFPLTVRDYLIISIGDSIASGEGNPDEIYLSPSSPDEWMDRPCHRSWNSGPALAARAMEQADDRTSVTFVSLACSGATLVPKYDDNFMAGGPNAQVTRAAELIRRPNGVRRPVDVVLVHGGANDLGFADLVEQCAFPKMGCTESYQAKHAVEQLAKLPANYFTLKLHIEMRLEPRAVFIAEYPDPTDAVNANGACDLVFKGAGLGGNISGEISKNEARWARDNVVLPLREQVRSAASANGWHFVDGITDAFSQHGYCSQDSWIVNFTQSWQVQNDKSGTMHPNGLGHVHYGKRLFAAIKPFLDPPRRSRPPATPLE
jgi:hypothetical protein